MLRRLKCMTFRRSKGNRQSHHNSCNTSLLKAIDLKALLMDLVRRSLDRNIPSLRRGLVWGVFRRMVDDFLLYSLSFTIGCPLAFLIHLFLPSHSRFCFRLLWLNRLAALRRNCSSLPRFAPPHPPFQYTITIPTFSPLHPPKLRVGTY